MEWLRQFPLLPHGKKRNAFQEFKYHSPFHEPLIRKRQRAAALQDASEGHVLPGFREVLDCASPLALWLPVQNGFMAPMRVQFWQLKLSMNL